MFARADFTRIDNLVLRLQQTCQLFGVDTHPRQLVYGDKDIDYFRLCAEQGYFHHSFGGDDLSFDAFRPVAHFFIRETVVADQSVINAEYIAEVVRYRWHGSSGGQLGLYVENLTTQFIPFLRDRCCGERRLQLECNLGKSVHGLRLYLVHSAHTLYFAGDRFGNEPFHFSGFGSGIACHNDRRLDDKGGVFFLSQTAE